jgi:hypothetical protein
MVATRSLPKISRTPWVNVVFPDPLSPATPRVKIYGEAAMVSLKFKWFMRYPGVVAYQVKTILRS